METAWQRQHRAVLDLARDEGNLDVWETGGGCTALCRFTDDAHEYVMLTALDDPSVPLTVDEPVTLSWNRTDDAQGWIGVRLVVTFPNLADALKALAWGPDTIPADLLPPMGESVPEWTADEFWAAERYQGGAK
jgi:hypothetical protein